METTTALSPNSLAFIALCNEYCVTLENAADTTRDDFIASMTRLLPRIYIAATALEETTMIDEAAYIAPALEEDYYDSLRRNIENLLGADDSYLEVFESDMKYSDTPIGASISECLADIFQSCYNFIEMIKDAPSEVVAEGIGAMKEDFEGYWSQILCNVMRPLNQLRFSPDQNNI